jgi:hypothetical protein
MYEQSIYIFLNRHMFSASAIHRELVTVLRLIAIAFSIVAKHERETGWTARMTVQKRRIQI